jgi:hypothetical protein
MEPAPIIVRMIRVGKARGLERHVADRAVMIAGDASLARVQDRNGVRPGGAFSR